MPTGPVPDAPSPAPPPGSAAPRRHFLGWDAPLLPTAARWLVGRARTPHAEGDFSRILVVVPGARSGRLLLGMLVDEASRRTISLVPPMLVTPGELIEPLIGVPGVRPATPLARELAWARVIAQATDAELKPLLGSHAPTLDVSRRSLATLIERLHTDLGGHGFRFADVVPHAADLAGPSESLRWHVASLLSERFIETLHGWGMADEVSARIARIESALDPSIGSLQVGFEHVVLVGVPELAALARRAIALAAARGMVVDSLIHAPESLAPRFDALGCVDAGAWASCDLPINEDQVAFASDQTEQAARALAWLAQSGPDTTTSDVVIGLADESLADLMSLEIRSVSSVRVRAAAGVRADRAEPARLLSLASNLLERRTLSSLVAFIGHPRVESWLLRDAGAKDPMRDWPWWLEALDDYAESRAPGEIDSLPEPSDARQSDALTLVTGAARELMGELWTVRLGGDESPLARDVASRATLALLRRLYGHLPAAPAEPDEARIARACVLLADDLCELISLTEDVPVLREQERPSAFLDQLVARQSAHPIPDVLDSDAIEMIGWLELAHDPSPSAVMIGMNDRNVPGAQDHDPMLPGALRRRLGMPTSIDRLARDSFLAATMARSRPRMLFVAPRRDDDGAPLVPSRLLLRCARKDLAGRMQRALGRVGDGPPRVVVPARASPAQSSRFPLAPIEDVPPVRRMSVTSFKTYIASPYLFYLRNVLRLQERGNDQPELSPMSFGALLHSTLETFGTSDSRDSTDASVVRAHVLDTLRTIARERFGPRPPVTVALQLEHAAIRLSHWSIVQAERARAGWRILHTEWNASGADIPESERPLIRVPEGQIELRGIVDRIDIHEPTGRIAILDYKSSDEPHSPHRSHRTRDGAWRDLQLPLYRELVMPLGLTRPITLGYFNIPRDMEKIAVDEAPWNDKDLLSADDAARDVVSRVLRREFGDLGRMNDEGTLGLIAGLDVLSDFVPVDPEGPRT